MSIFPWPACSIPNSYHTVANFGYTSTAFSKLVWASPNFFFLIASIPFSYAFLASLGAASETALIVLPSSAGPLRCSRMVPTLGSSIGRLPASGTVCERYPPRLACKSQPMYLRSAVWELPGGPGVALVPVMPETPQLPREPNSLASWITPLRAPNSIGFHISQRFIVQRVRPMARAADGVAKRWDRFVVLGLLEI